MCSPRKSNGGIDRDRLMALKHRLQAATYGRGKEGQSWTRLFEVYDADGSGELDFDEVRPLHIKYSNIKYKDTLHVKYSNIRTRCM